MISRRALAPVFSPNGIQLRTARIQQPGLAPCGSCDGSTTMEINREPLAYFITWTVYGTFLRGDGRWWRKKKKGTQPPQPRLEEWHRDRLRHEIILLSAGHRETVKSEIEDHCEFRQWHLWIANPRTNHVHVVVTAPGFAGDVVRDQLKANCTRGLREQDQRFVDRPVWTVRGDWQCVNTDEDLELAIQYAGEAQDRMEYK